MNEQINTDADNSVAKDNTALRELTEIKVDQSLTLPLRIQRFIVDVRDPYHFTVNGTEVKIHFGGDNSIDTQLACALSALNDLEKKSCNTFKQEAHYE